MSDINFPGGGGGGGGTRSPLTHPDLQMSHHPQFPPNHPLNALGNFMGISGLHGIPSLQQHNDVLEKLKMQVRDMKMDQDYAAAAHAAAFGSNMLPSQLSSAFSLPPSSAASFGHGAQSLSVHPSPGNMGNSSANGVSGLPNGSNSSANNSFSFASPTAPGSKEVNPASNSSTSSEASNSSQQNNGWSFEEQYKQVRQLYEINDDPKRKEFLDDLFSFMQKRGTPINRLPIMAKSVLDLYELYNLVIARGGLVDVINKKLWQEIIKGLHLPSSITSAAFTLRTQYMKYLYPYECEKKNLSTPAELQAAIDGNRREGRRSSYGQYEAMHNQMQMPQLARQTLAGSMQQMSPLALVTHAAAANNQQAQAAAVAAAHHRLMTPPFGQVPNLVKHEIEQRMMEYLKLIQAKEDHNSSMSSVGGASGVGGNVGSNNALNNSSLAQVHHQQQHQQQQAAQQQQLSQQQRRRSQSPELREAALNALEMSRVAFWQMYNNTTSPPASINASPQINPTASNNDQQRNEALNLSDSPPNLSTIKREREREPSPEPERDDFQHQPPPNKRSMASSLMPPGFPNFYLPHNLAAAANFHQHSAQQAESDNEHEEDHEDDEDNEHNVHNATTISSNHEEPEQTNGHHVDNHSQIERQHHDNKSDDSAIENSPTTSSAGGNGHNSPISTKKIHLTKQHLQQTNDTKMLGGGGGGVRESSNSNKNVLREGSNKNQSSDIGPLETLNLLSGMQFKVARNGFGPNGEQQLLVNLELNGIKYSGLLMANLKDSEMKTFPMNGSGGGGASNSGSLKNEALNSPRKPLSLSKHKRNSSNNCLSLEENERVLEKSCLNEHQHQHHHQHHEDDEIDEDALEAEEAQELRRISSEREDDFKSNQQVNLTKPTTTITATTLLTKDAVLSPLTPTKTNLSKAQMTSSPSSSSSASSSSSSSCSSSSSAHTSHSSQQVPNGPSPVTSASSAAAVAAATASALQNLKDALITS